MVSTLGKQNGSSQISNQCLVVSVGGVVVKPFVMVLVESSPTLVLLVAGRMLEG